MNLDLGCGKVKKEGFIGVDSIKFDSVDVVLDIGKEKWPWKANSVENIHCSHTLEHLTAQERIHFYNEAYRVLKKTGKMVIITPHWNSTRAYGDPTHQWPPVSEFSFNYLNKQWREYTASHVPGLNCDFEHECSGALNPMFKERTPELIPMAHFLANAIDDLVTVLWKRKT